MLNSCSIFDSRLKIKSPQPVIDQLEQLSLYGYWESKQGYLHIDCTGSFSLNYNFNNLTIKDQIGYISKIDSVKRQLTIKHGIQNSKYYYKSLSTNKLDFQHSQHNLKNKLKGYFHMTLTKKRSYNCEELRKMNPAELAKFMLINHSEK